MNFNNNNNTGDTTSRRRSAPVFVDVHILGNENQEKMAFPAGMNMHEVASALEEMIANGDCFSDGSRMRVRLSRVDIDGARVAKLDWIKQLELEEGREYVYKFSAIIDQDPQIGKQQQSSSNANADSKHANETTVVALQQQSESPANISNFDFLFDSANKLAKIYRTIDEGLNSHLDGDGFTADGWTNIVDSLAIELLAIGPSLQQQSAAAGGSDNEQKQQHSAMEMTMKGQINGLLQYWSEKLVQTGHKLLKQFGHYEVAETLTNVLAHLDEARSTILLMPSLFYDNFEELEGDGAAANINSTTAPSSSTPFVEATASKTREEQQQQQQRDELKLDEYLDALVQANVGHGRSKEAMSIVRDRLRRTYMRIVQFEKEELKNKWGRAEITKYANEFRAKSDDTAPISVEEQAKLIAMLRCASKLTTGKYPRVAQIMALLVLLSPGNKRGKLIQVFTGEGKSLITVMSAAYLVIVGGTGHRTDIITSNPELAKRDADDEKFVAFFKLLGLTVSHCCTKKDGEEEEEEDKKNKEEEEDDDDDTKNGYKKAYDADIVNGDISSFQGDYLRKFTGKPARANRPFHSVVIDEADAQLIDDLVNMRTLMLAQPIPGSEHLHGLLVGGWAYWLSIQWIRDPSNWKRHADGSSYELSARNSHSGAERVQQIDEHPNQLVKHMLEKWFIAAIGGEIEIGFPIPVHLKAYALGQAKNWAESAEMALHLEEGKDYAIREDRNRRKRIEILDYRNTGCLLKDTHWQNYLHEFLQIKHSLRISRETVMGLYCSNLGYLCKYGQMFGMTGTLGSVPSQQFLCKQYDVELAFLPAHRPKQFTLHPGILVDTREQWSRKIVDLVKMHSRAGKSVLVINQTVNSAMELGQRLQRELEFSESDRIRPYYIDADHRAAVERPVGPGDIILSTSLAGRGTDIETREGTVLVVLLCFLADNLRIELQALGRTSRQGKPGEGQIILCREDLCQQYGQEIVDQLRDFDTVIAVRNALEEEQLRTCETRNIPSLKMNDRLFTKFSEFIFEHFLDNCKLNGEELNELKKKKLEKKEEVKEKKRLEKKKLEGIVNKLEQCVERWALWLKQFLESLDSVDESTDWHRKEKEACEKLEQFLMQIERELKCSPEEQLFTNPSSAVFEGRRLMSEDEYKKADKLFERAANIGSETAAGIAHYNRAQNYLCQNEAIFCSNNRRTRENDHLERRAAESLQLASRAMHDEIARIAATQAMMAPAATTNSQQQQSSISSSSASVHGATTLNTQQRQRQQQTAGVGGNNSTARRIDDEFAQQQQEKIDVLAECIKRVQQQLEVIAKREGNRCVRISAVNSLKEMFPEEKRKQMEEECAERAMSGMPAVYESDYAEPKNSFWTIFGLVVLGALQIGLGCVALCCGCVGLGTTAILSGAKDIYTAIQIATGKHVNFNWGDYWCEKAAIYGQTMLCSFGTFMLHKFPALQQFAEFLLRGTLPSMVNVGQVVSNALQNEPVQQILKNNSAQSSQLDTYSTKLAAEVKIGLYSRLFNDAGVRIKLCNLLMTSSDNKATILHNISRVLYARNDQQIRKCTARLLEKFRRQYNNSTDNINLRSDTGFAMVLDEIAANLKAEIDTMARAVSVGGRIVEAISEDQPAGIAARIDQILRSNGNLLYSGTVLASEGADRCRHADLPVAQRELMIRTLTECQSLLRGEAVERATCVEAEIVSTVQKAFANGLHDGANRLDPEDVQKLADAFQKF